MYQVYVYFSMCKYMFYVAVRARLSGMVITGSISADGRGTELYRDSSNVADCTDKYTNPAYPVCQDIITIPVSMDDVRYVKISTTDYLTLCEVEVFAGIQGYIKQKPIVFQHDL